MPPSKRERAALLLGVILLLGGLKLTFNPGLGRNSLDGDFYFQIARHVAEGDGLETSVSLYHQGLKHLPHPSNASPLWPLLLGWSGRAVGLGPAAHLLPELLYLLDLLLLYLLTVALAEGAGGGAGLFLARGGGVVDVGHVVVLLFGLHRVFFEFTSLPYTEALAFALLLGALLAVSRAATGPALPWALVAGVAAGAAYLTRAQMAGLLVAVVAGLALLDLARWRPPWAALAATGAAALVVLPWVLYLASWITPFNPRVMIALGSYRETPEVLPFQFSVPTSGWLELIADRLWGLWVAFDPTSADSYVASFGPWAYLVPLALLQVAVRPRRWRSGLARLATEPCGIAVLTTLLAGLALLAPVHLSHARFFKEWLFGFRHGLPLILLLVVALAHLNGLGDRLARWLALALVAASLAGAAVGLGTLLHTRFPSGLLGPEPELVAWLDAQRPPVAVVTTNAQPLAVFSRSAYHWMECREAPEQTLALLRHAGAAYVLAYPGEERCPFLRGLGGQLEMVRELGAAPFRIRVLRLAPSTPGGPATP